MTVNLVKAAKGLVAGYSAWRERMWNADFDAVLRRQRAEFAERQAWRERFLDQFDADLRDMVREAVKAEAKTKGPLDQRIAQASASVAVEQTYRDHAEAGSVPVQDPAPTVERPEVCSQCRRGQSHE